MKKLVVVIDTQYDFMMEEGALPVPGAESMIVNGIKYLSKLTSEDTYGVLFTHDTHTPDVYNGSPESEQFPIHCVQGTPGWENVFNPLIVPLDIELFQLNKGVFNMWEEEDISVNPTGKQREEFFESRKELFDYVEIWGVASDFCVKWAIDGFVKRGYKVKVVENLTRGIVDPIHRLIDDWGGAVELI